MFTYETLDAVADAYNPTLLFICIMFSAFCYKENGLPVVIKCFLGMFICYLVMFADMFLKIWPLLSLDYSTHSSIAFSLVYGLIHKRRVKSFFSLAFITSLVCYYLLMLYQQYHTVQDMVSTLIVIIPLIFYTYRRLDLLR